MLRALIRAFGDLSAPPLRHVVVLSLVIAVASFAVLWLGVALLLEHLPITGWAMLDWPLKLFGAIGVAWLSWLLFPAVVTLVMGFFLERVAAAVEAIDHPERGPPRPMAIREVIGSSLRLMTLTVALNLLALPVYLLLPGINLFVFLGLNGYLLGREYFEVVALRRLDQGSVRVLRQRFAGRVFAGGIAIAALFMVPLVNLVAAVVGTALMVHLFDALPRSASPNPAA